MLNVYRQSGARLLLTLALLSAASSVQAALKTADVPLFQLRARITSAAGKDPEDRKFTFRFSVRGPSETVQGSQWSGWMGFGTPQAEATLRGYPALYMNRFPVVVNLQVDGVIDPTAVEAELKFNEGGDPVPLSGKLFGPGLGILLWRDEQNKPQAATMAVYNRRYWKVLEGIQLPASERPQKFPIVDRFIGGDQDREDWQEGIQHLAEAGMSTIMLPDSKLLRKMLLHAGLDRTAWAVYNPPGYAFDYDPGVTPEAIQQWAQKQVKPYLDEGYSREEMAMFVMSDEPGWYYPSMFAALEKNPTALARFRDYLKSQHLQPADLGAARWEEVLPIGRSQASTLPLSRLFYWSMRFFAWDSARHFANCTRALENAFYPGIPVVTNWNFFSGRFYVPGPVANNPDKGSIDAAMGGHDPFEFGRLRGDTMLWTEDWFPDSMAYQWSLYCARLRSAAAKSGVQFGGYVIPRTAGDREDGIVQKILTIIGSGGKGLIYFVFGPEYNFPGNCYSENAAILKKMAEAHRMIRGAEDILWPGKRLPSRAAILAPRSAETWDARKLEHPTQIQDATATDVNASTVDYMAETFDLYLALQHSNIPVDFVDEDDLVSPSLKSYRVLYLTEPDIPIEAQRALVPWVHSGGILVMVASAGSHDRYDQPCGILQELAGIKETPRERMLIPSLNSLAAVGSVRTAAGTFQAAGVRATVAPVQATVQASFEDNTPAVLQRKVGNGQVLYFALMPGLSYARSSTGTKDRLPTGFSDALREMIVSPIQLARITPSVSVDSTLVETPLLLTPNAAAITLLNWRGESLEKLNVMARLPFEVRQVESVRRGKLAFRRVKGGAAFSLPLGSADIVMLRGK